MKKFLLILGAFMFALLLFLGIGWGYLMYEQSQINAGELEKFQVARALWDQSSFTDYEITVHYAYYLEKPCDRVLKYESEKDRVILIKDDCYPIIDFQPYSINVMFDTIEHWLVDEYQCGLNGCGCDGPLVIKGEYDPVYGFPTSFSVDSDREQAWKFKEYWQLTLEDKFSRRTVICHVLGRSYPNFAITAFTPLNP